MTKSIYAQISRIKHNKHDKAIVAVREKREEIEQAQEKQQELETELKTLLDAFPRKKKAVYDEYLGETVHKDVFEKIGYKIMVLEHEISAHKLKIQSQEEAIAVLEEEFEGLEKNRRELARVVEKYNVMLDIEAQERKALAEYKEDQELEEFSKPKKSY